MSVEPTQTILRFWGVRGSIPCPDPAMARYGGNTACVEVRCGNRIVIFDGGSGLRGLGSELIKNRWPIKADIFYSHCHMDHVCGLPFFAPVDRASTTLRLWAGNLLPRHNLKQTFGQIFGAPFFPDDTFQRLSLSAEFHDFRAGDTLTPHPDIVIRSAPLIHPGGSTGYRLEHGGRAIAYITDTEHKPDDLDKRVLALAKDADVLIYDCMYTREEHASHVGWGHSTWQEGVRLADAASAKSLAIFHHDPGHDDRFLDGVAAEARALRPGTFVAAEGTSIRLG